MNAVDHYDGDYYRTHYARVWNDARYYELQSLFWRYTIFECSGLDTGLSVLDYGCGLGQISGALPKRACFDVSAEARGFLRTRGARVFDRPTDIGVGEFDAVLCSHTLEHHAQPRDTLTSFLKIVHEDGLLILALPVEVNIGPSIEPDSDRHFYAWTFQTVTNLLVDVGWAPFSQRMVYGPFMLKTLGGDCHVSDSRAVQIASVLGRWRRTYPTMLTLARKSSRVL